jgi:general secretion pathway protein N
MKRLWPFAALAVIAYLVFALITLPASVIVNRVQLQGVTIAGVEGTIWNGNAQVVRIGATHLGSMSWKLHALPLLTLRGSADFKLSRTDGFAQGAITASGQQVDFKDLTAALPIAALPPQVAPGGWTGSVNAKLARLILENGWPTSAIGTVDVVDLTGPARKPVNLGSYQLKFPAESQVKSPAADTLVGSINDIAGPIQIAGTIQLKSSDRSYLLDGLVATKPNAPADFTRTLEFLGPPDAQGRRQFSLSGTM